MQNKKGQAAMEFLMTYGWAILVVLAAIGALAYFGVLSPDRFLPSKCTVTGGFSCTEYKIDDTNEQFQINIQNNLGVDAEDITITVTTEDCDGSNSDVLTNAAADGDDDYDNGERTGVLNFVCPDVAGGDDLSGKVRGTIDITYTRSGETVTHSTTGTVDGNAET